MTSPPKVLVVGAGGRVGLALVGALAQHGVSVVAVDCLPAQELTARVNRVFIDAVLLKGQPPLPPAVEGGIDVLNVDQLSAIIAREAPHIVVNYAIPFTWDAARSLPNYATISSAGLGAFAPTQLLAPRAVGKAISDSGIKAHFIVGNLPDITIPILSRMPDAERIARPVGGAGNVGLIANALRYCIARDFNTALESVEIALCAHHVHWVAPREPGYPDDAPFLLRASVDGEDITAQLGDSRAYMNNAITGCYEPGAGFSSTTGLLAAQFALALLDNQGHTHRLHIPAVDGMPGGYPADVAAGQVTLKMPADWRTEDAIAAMEQANQRDGVERIGDDGTVYFNPESVAIMRRELGIALPRVMPPGDLVEVAREQIRLAQAATA